MNSPESKKIDKVLWICSIALFLQMLLSYNLWLSINRTYPTIPAFQFLDFELGKSLTQTISGVLLASLLFLPIKKQFRETFIGLIVITSLFLILEDITRLQIWFYLYLIIFITIALGYRKHPQKVLKSIQFTLAMVYFWTGIQKMNIQFVTDIYTWMIGIFEFSQPLEKHVYLGYFMGLTEILIGLFLLINKTRRTGILAASLMHIIILILLVKDEWNSVVYPWNIAMILLVILLFWETDTVELKQQKPHIFILLLIGIAPLLDFVGLWPHYLSFGMYSGLSLDAEIFFANDKKNKCVPKVMKKDIYYYSKTQSSMNIDTWAMNDLNVPTVSNEAIFMEVTKSFCQCSKDSLSGVEILTPYRFKNDDKIKIYTCPELK